MSSQIYVPFVDLKAQHTTLMEEIKEAVFKVIENCNFILGKEVERFEEEFAKFLNVKYAVGVSSGLDALILALKGLDIGYGDEVLLPVNTFIATALAVNATGATPIFVDCEEESFNIDFRKIESAISPKTKAIIPVHLYGQSCNMDKIFEISKKYSLYVIEDAAQAHGTLYKGIPCGSMGIIGTFSFYPSKNLGACGDGGMVVSNNKEIAEKIKCLRNYGQEVKYKHTYKGGNNRLDTIQAAVLGVKLKYLNEWNLLRIHHANEYDNLLKDVPNIKTPARIYFSTHIYHLYVIRCKFRNELMKFLKENGVETGIHYPIPIHIQEAYKDLGYKKGDFPVAEKLSEEILSLPMFPELKKEQIEYVVEMIIKFYRNF